MTEWMGLKFVEDSSRFANFLEQSDFLKNLVLIIGLLLKLSSLNTGFKENF